MRFKITLNMPAKSGALVHQILCESKINSLADMNDYLETHDFLLVDQLYVERGAGNESVLVPNGQVSLNRMVVGKIEELEER